MRSIFHKLQRLLRPTKVEPSGQLSNPFGLNNTSIAALREFRASAAFEAFTAALDEQCRLNGENLLSVGARDPAYANEIRGYILGLRHAATLVDEIVSAQARVQEHNARRAQSESNFDDLSRARRALFGTSAWRSG